MDQPVIAKKQFIAGAVCPQCDAIDRIVVEVTLATAGQPTLSRRRCVQCNFADDFGATPQTVSQGVPKGRPERRKTVAPESTVVRIVIPDKPLDNPKAD